MSEKPVKNNMNFEGKLKKPKLFLYSDKVYCDRYFGTFCRKFNLAQTFDVLNSSR